MQVGWCGSSVACATARGCCGSVAVSVSPGCLGSFATAGFNFSARTALDIQLPKSSFDCILKPLSQFAVTWHLSPAARHKRGVSVRPNPRKRRRHKQRSDALPFRYDHAGAISAGNIQKGDDAAGRRSTPSDCVAVCGHCRVALVLLLPASRTLTER